MFDYQVTVNPMKEVRTYIHPFALGSQIQKLDVISGFLVTVSKYEGFDRENGEPGDGELWRGQYAA